MQNNHFAKNEKKSQFDLRLEKRFEDENLLNFASTYYDHSETTIIKVKLERAVIEYAEGFRKYFNNELKLNNNDYIVDLSDALFLDSTFLGTIIYFYKQVNNRGADLSIVVDLNKVKILSHLKNLELVLNTYSSIESATAGLKL